jgi:UDP:flavonoid glycosyltransferase YjiC (YdhE family)
MERKRILFVAEAVTLAHVARPLALAQGLDPQRYEVHFACASGYEFCFSDSRLQHWPLHSISSRQFLHALAHGKPVYEETTLAHYVADDLQLLDSLRPDVVVGDFRLSLSVSARLSKVPYVALVNAYWSPYVRQHYVVPALPLSRYLPLPLANALFLLARPLAFAAHARPLNQVRRTFGLPPLPPDLRHTYTDADHTLYPDIPELFPANDLPEHHHYIGPVIWSPPMAPPHWWDTLPPGKPIVYVTLGSSGQGRLLPLALAALAPLELTVLAATAGNVNVDWVPPNARVAPFLPGEAAARRAALVICNGGSPTSQQALAAGVPVLGVAGNLDQFLNMHAIVRAGAGALLRADRLTEVRLRQAVRVLLENGAAGAAKDLARLFGRVESGSHFQAQLLRLLDAQH